MPDCRENCTVVIPEGRLVGWCERHQCEKTIEWIKLCQKKDHYFLGWERGVGPGQVKPRGIPASSAVKAPSGGAGTELKLILKRFRIVPTGTCKCNQRAREMDSNGIEWCEEHLEEIVDWLEEEAKNRHLSLVFTRAEAKILVRRAISNAKQKDKIKDDPIHHLSGSFEMRPSPEAFQ